MQTSVQQSNRLGCGGLVPRRDFLTFGSLAGLGWLGSLAASAPLLNAGGPSGNDHPNEVGQSKGSQSEHGLPAGFGRAKRCVLVWLDGGPSHLEMFDPKPQATDEVRGPLSVIATRQPGVRFGEGLSELARRSDRVTVIRSMTSPVGEHNLATQYALSGHIPGGRAAAPAFMLPVSQILQAAPPLPTHVAVPNLAVGGGAGVTGFLGDEAQPWSIGADPADSDLASRVWPSTSLSPARLQRRQQLLQLANSAGAEENPAGSIAAFSSRDFSTTQSSVEAVSSSSSKVAASDGLPANASSENSPLHTAIDLLRSAAARRVFDLERESPQTRGRYGRKSIGQGCLLARRLLEAGVPMVTINNRGWDTHDALYERLHAGYSGAKVPVGLIPSLDMAIAALLDDLETTGLLEDTLVIVMGEFGRTPKINTQGGRDHWPRAYSVLLAGAGVPRGLIHGRTDSVGEVPVNAPVTPADLVATLYHLLGLQPHQRVPTPDGQQMSRVPDTAGLIRSLLG